MPIKTSVSGIQAAKSAIQKRLQEFQTREFVTIGVHEDAGVHEGDNLTNATLGAYLHFGTENIPSRAWLDVGVATATEQYADIIRSVAEEGLNLDDALNQIGLVAAGAAQVFMTELSSPPNAESTIARKGSSNPLIDTGALRQSVAHKIQPIMPTEGLS